ncbi:polysaccharide biosynthesis protein [Rheinheimera sediminis]|uniref:oligosaccharide flippase family protein n=1 Tax=Rheinheimera sp. YQF-1 TaxID=2499626 RepID=UPI000FDCD89F|nr:oligosaccharide flippase family protein [Rheinheimera sp. YQF-1]RVT46917.1 polysaccharide biosynthesis protein [Rheinheimera sp. YQF-1]
MGIDQVSLSNVRSNNYFTQLKVSALYKVVAIAASFIALPIMLKYLGPERFGIWTTMLTLLTWVMLFDLGIGNGLKNKVSESIAKDNSNYAAEYISTAYMLIGLISFILFASFLIAAIWLPWQSIFNTQFVSEVDLKSSVITLSFFIFFNFWISLINQIYHGLQKSSVVVVGQCMSNSFALVFISILYNFTEPSILLIVYGYGFALVLTNVVFSLFLFKRYPQLIPTGRKFDRNKIKPLLSLGIKFFIIQLAVLVIFMTDKILITQLLGPEHVTPYEVLFKLFSIITILHGMILIPLWPAYSDAYNRGEFDWIRRNIKQQLKIALFLFICTFLMAVLGPIIVSIWTDDLVSVSPRLYYLFALFIAFTIWSNVFAYFVNAVNKLNLQLFTAVIAAIVNVPLSVYFVRVLDMGLEGILLATVISLSFFSLLGPIQVYRILVRKR